MTAYFYKQQQKLILISHLVSSMVLKVFYLLIQYFHSFFLIIIFIIDKWCQVVLLDTIIAFQEGLEPKISQQRRRQFNQYLAFRESIIVVASEAWISYIK